MTALAHMDRVADRIMTAEEAVARVRPGQSVFVGSGCGAPIGLVTALEARKPAP